MNQAELLAKALDMIDGKQSDIRTKIDTSDPGKAANVAARAAMLFARVSGYIVENTVRERDGFAPAYRAESFEFAIQDYFPETCDARFA